MTKDEALARLHELLKPGDTVHTILRHVARSGMSRRISAVKIGPDGDTFQLDHLIEAIGLARTGKHEGLIIGGCGMDMGFHLVYELSSRLFPDGFGCIGKGADGSGIYCPSNDHSNGDRSYEPHNQPLIDELRANGVSDKLAANHWHRSGGYALKHRWL